jgi:hypothetical protein
VLFSLRPSHPIKKQDIFPVISEIISHQGADAWEKAFTAFNLAQQDELWELAVEACDDLVQPVDLQNILSVLVTALR